MRTNPLPSVELALRRFATFAPLAGGDAEALRLAARSHRLIAARGEIFTEGVAITEPLILLAGWAYRSRVLSDGRRQILNFLLPGDLLGLCRHSNPAALTSVVALTDVVVCAAPTEATGGLAEAYAISGAMEEYYLLRQITRLGRMSAQERIADWLLEIRDRLELSGSILGSSFPLPVTQEIIADTLGLTSVHVNRTLQAMRRDGQLDARNGVIVLQDVERLKSSIDNRPLHVTAI